MDAYSRLFGATLFPLLDLANGTKIAAKLKELLRSEFLDRAEIARRQQREVERVVRETRERSLFYQRHWQRNSHRGGGGPASAFAALDGLPVVTKSDLAEAPAGSFPLPGHRGRLITVKTSGSTGMPMTFHRTLEQESFFWALRFRIWHWAGYCPGDRYLTINLNPRLGWKKKLQDRLFRCSYLTFNADNQDSARVVAALRGRRIEHLNGFSSSLYVLASYMLREGLEAPSVRGITATGDTLYAPYRETIEKAFGVPVLDYYGAGGEGIHLASQTVETLAGGGRYLLHPENALVEFLGPQGPVGPGELGRIVITQFHNAAMPLIRYELGDLAVPAPADAVCPSGRTLPMMERVEGRVPDLIVVPDGSFLVPHFFVVLFKNIQQIHRYQIVQREVGRMTARLVALPGTDQVEVEATVRRAVDQGTRGQLTVDVEWLDDIPLAGAGKRRLVISDLARQLVMRPDDRAASLQTSGS